MSLKDSRTRGKESWKWFRNLTRGWPSGTRILRKQKKLHSRAERVAGKRELRDIVEGEF